jgi:hypothetical protein
MAKKNTTTTTGKSTGSKPTPPAPPPPPKPAPAKSPQTGSSGSKGTKGKAQTTNPAPAKGKPGFTPAPQAAGTTTAKKVQGGENKGADAKGSSNKPAFASSKPIVKPGWKDTSWQPKPVPGQILLAAKGTQLAQDVLLALQHEGKPAHISDEKWLQRFARNGWHDEETQQAHKVLKMWDAKSDIKEFIPLFQINPPNPNDPRIGTCDNLVGQEYASCISNIISQLRQIAWSGLFLESPASVMLTYYLSLANNERGNRPVYLDPNLLLQDAWFMDFSFPIMQPDGTPGTFRDGVIPRLEDQIGGNTEFQQFVLSSMENPNTIGDTVSLNLGIWEESNIRVEQQVNGLSIDGIRIQRGYLEDSIGGGTIRPYDPLMQAQIISQDPTSITVTLSLNIEFYDRYDWCGIDPNCSPDAIDQGLYGRQGDPNSADYLPDFQTNPNRGLGTPDHPFGMYTGDFTSIEKAGQAGPFDIFSNWTQSNVITVPLVNGVPDFEHVNIESYTVTIHPLTSNTLHYGDGTIEPGSFTGGIMGDMEDNDYIPSPYYQEN